MPPKPKLKKETIIDIAFEHVRSNGWKGLTARYLAEKLGTSTKPIYFHFSAMAEIEDVVVKRAMAIVLDYVSARRTGDVWIDQAVGLVMFALEEKHLFRAIFDERHVAARRKYSVQVWKAGEKELADYPMFQDLSQGQVEVIRRARWMFTHGLSSLMNISNWPRQTERESDLINMIQRISRAIYNEFKDDPDALLSSAHFSDLDEPDKQ